MKKLIAMLVATAMLCVSCDEVITEFCVPQGYRIIYDGEHYTWQFVSSGMIFPVMFDTPEEAIKDVIEYGNALKDNTDRYKRIWVGIPACTDYPSDKELIL